MYLGTAYANADALRGLSGCSQIVIDELADVDFTAGDFDAGKDPGTHHSGADGGRERPPCHGADAVSYTHLTLPTIA